jgi:hypothetical protein
LYHSIKCYHNDFIFYALAFDKETFNYLSNLHYENLIPISFETYNSYFNTNQEKYEDRKQYYFSATSNICIYLLENYPTIDKLLYLDADVYVLNSLDSLYEEFEDHSIGYCPHRLHPIIKHLTKNHGNYNVGVNLFKNSDIALKCLYDWKSDCEGWYKSKPGYHLYYFSDQIFLDSWEKKYSGIKIINNIGIDTAPWNAVNYHFKKVDDVYFVNQTPIIIYHFSALKKLRNDEWNCNTIIYLASIKGELLNLYKSYINNIESFNIGNDKVAEIRLNRGLGKRIFYFIMNIFLNETVKITE